jgi:amino acid permease
MVKLMLGAGVLAMANAFSKAGLWAGVVLYPTLGILCWYTMMLLLDAKKEAER